MRGEVEEVVQLIRRLLPLALLICMVGQHAATVLRVVDGDTIAVSGVVLSRVAGPNGALALIFDGKIRLIDVWAPEPYKAGGPEATAWMKGRLAVGEQVCIEGTNLDVFGRMLSWVYDSDGQVNAGIVAAGLATRTKP
jgi:endonuclease YncB( thermonuclease family)